MCFMAMLEALKPRPAMKVRAIRLVSNFFMQCS
jgi:hypothetical protein